MTATTGSTPSSSSAGLPAAAASQVDPAHRGTASSPEVGTSSDHRIARLTGVQILACGSYASPHGVTNADLAQHGYDPDWTVQRTGIVERRRAADEIAASDLAYEAATRCLQQACLAATDLDLIVLATM